MARPDPISDQPCPSCGKPMGSDPAGCPGCAQWLDWARRRDTLRTQWVVAVLAFWITLVLAGVLYYLTGSMSLILAAVGLGTMILGVWLKARYQLHIRRDPAVAGRPA